MHNAKYALTSSFVSGYHSSFIFVFCFIFICATYLFVSLTIISKKLSHKTCLKTHTGVVFIPNLRRTKQLIPGTSVNCFILTIFSFSFQFHSSSSTSESLLLEIDLARLRRFYRTELASLESEA